MAKPHFLTGASREADWTAWVVVGFFDWMVRLFRPKVGLMEVLV